MHPRVELEQRTHSRDEIGVRQPISQSDSQSDPHAPCGISLRSIHVVIILSDGHKTIRKRDLQKNNSIY